MWNKAIAIFFSAICLLSIGYAGNDEIVIRLSSAKPLMPLYLAPLQTDGADFSPDYLKQLARVARFDLNYNGSTKVVELSKRPDGVDTFDAALDFTALKECGLFYLVRMKCKKNELAAQVISVNGQESRQIDRIFLSGELNRDRQKIHQLSDAIHQMLFNKPGIATTKMLFTIKKRVPMKGRKDPEIVSNVYEADYDGANVRQVTKESCYVASPCYIPTMKGVKSGAFLYVSYRIGQPKIYVGSLLNGTTKRLTAIRGNQLTPAVSRDGKQFAFACDIMGTSDLYVQRIDAEFNSVGKPQQIFRTKGAAEASPVFSPDGRRVAFVSNKDGSPRIYVMDIPEVGTKIESIKPRLISKRNRENSAPAWSPDGTKIAYSAKSNGDRQIWIYDFDIGQEWQLTDGAGPKENPTWAKDSLHLMFNAKVKETSELYLVNLNQPEAVRVSDGAGDKMFPNFEP